jgi:hypothetical protein
MDPSLLGTAIARRPPRQGHFALGDGIDAGHGLRQLVNALGMGRVKQAIVSQSNHEAIARADQLSEQREVIRFAIHDVDHTCAIDSQRADGGHLSSPTSTLVVGVVFRLGLFLRRAPANVM